MRKFISFVLVIVFVGELIPPQSTAVPLKPDDRFGMTEAFWQPEEAAELGVGWERILFYWREIQPTGPDDWNTLHVLEEWLVEADAQGRTVVGLLKNTAPWASEDGTEAGLPKGLYLPENHPDNLWANYLRKIARYYSQRNVHHWIIWNEPEIKAGVYGYEFAGGVKDYYQMLKIAYKVIKAEDPQSVIHLAGLTWWHDQSYLDRLLAMISRDSEARKFNDYFDVISLHIYFRPETIPIIMTAVNSLLTKYDIDKEIWINETNAPPNRDPYWPINRPDFQVDLDQQAWFILQAFGLGFATGAQRIGVYKLIDIHLPPGGESFGILRPDFSRRPAFLAYQTATRYLRDFDEVDLERSPKYYLATFSRPQGTTRMIWTRTPVTTTLQLPAKYERAQLISYDGNPQWITPEGGTYSVELEGARCYGECLIGGPPLLLVETNPSLILDSTLILEKVRQVMKSLEEEFAVVPAKEQIELKDSVPPKITQTPVTLTTPAENEFTGTSTNSAASDKIEIVVLPTVTTFSNKATSFEKNHTEVQGFGKSVPLIFIGVLTIIVLIGLILLIREWRLEK